MLADAMADAVRDAWDGSTVPSGQIPAGILETLESTVALTGAGLALLDSDLTILWASPSLVDEADIDPAAVVGADAAELFAAPSTLRELRRVLRNAVLDDTPVEEELVRVKVCEQRGATGRLDAKRIDNPGGAPLLLITVVREMTPASSTATHDAEQPFRLLAENLPEVVWLQSADGTDLAYVNPAYETVWGRPRAQLYRDPLSWMYAVHEDDRERILESWRVADRSQSFEIEYRIVRPDGDIRHLFVRGFPLCDESGVAVLTVGMATDVTDRVRADAVLRTSERRLRTFAENLREVVWIQTADGKRVEYVNPAYEQVWGRPVHELYGNANAWSEAIHEEDRDHVERQWQAIREANFDTEYRVVRPDGSIRWIWDRGSPVYDESGEVSALIGVAEDITERRRMERERLHTERLASLGTLTAGIAHEINNPLGLIALAAHEALADEAPDTHRRCLAEIRDHVDRCARIIKGMLEFARQGSAERRPVRVGDSIERARDLTQGAARRHRVDVEYELDDEVPAVMANPTQLEQVFVALIVNAVQACYPGGKVSVRTSQSFEGARIVISDDGIGMTDEQKSRVFDPFYTTRANEDGTGLGCSTAHGIVSDLGGKIEVESGVGVGSTFTIDLPAVSTQAR